MMAFFNARTPHYTHGRQRLRALTTQNRRRESCQFGGEDPNDLSITYLPITYAGSHEDLHKGLVFRFALLPSCIYWLNKASVHSVVDSSLFPCGASRLFLVQWLPTTLLKCARSCSQMIPTLFHHPSIDLRNVC